MNRITSTKLGYLDRLSISGPDNGETEATFIAGRSLHSVNECTGFMYCSYCMILHLCSLILTCVSVGFNLLDELNEYVQTVY